MQLHQIIGEQELVLSAVNDANSANRFLSRAEKIDDRGEVQVLVREKLKALETQLEELEKKEGEDSPKAKGLGEAITVLKNWVDKNPVARVVNPGRKNFGATGAVGGSQSRYAGGDPSN